MPLRNLTAVGVWLAVGATAVAAQQNAKPATDAAPSAAARRSIASPPTAAPAPSTPPAPRLAAVQPATARPPGGPIASLHWTRLDGASQCIAPGDLAARVERIMAQPVWAPSSAGRFVVQGWVIARLAPERGFVTQVSIVAPDGQVIHRVRMNTTADNCHVLDDVLGQTVATGLVFASPSFEPGHAESGATLSTPHLVPDFNPYMNPLPDAYGRASSSPTRMQREEPSPNPYAGHPDRTAGLQPYFNPYMASGPARAVVAVLAQPQATHDRFDLDSNPYYPAPTTDATLRFNPYRP